MDGMASTGPVYYPLAPLLTMASPARQSRTGETLMTCPDRPGFYASRVQLPAMVLLMLGITPAVADVSCPMSISVTQNLTAPATGRTCGA
jgi:hypothetical protein